MGGGAARLIQHYLAGIVANHVHDLALEDAAVISVARLRLLHLSPDCLEALTNVKDMVALNQAEEPHYLSPTTSWVSQTPGLELTVQG